MNRPILEGDCMRRMSLAIVGAALWLCVVGSVSAIGWSPAGNLAAGRGNLALTLLNSGKALATGGSDSNGTSLKTVEVYDPAANAWSSAAAMSVARAGHTATVLQNGKVLVVGGGDSQANPLSSAELFDPSSNSWS